MEVPRLDGLEPRGLDGEAANGVHPAHGLLDGGEVVDTVGLPQRSAGAFGGTSRLPLAALLDKRDAVAATFVTDADEEGFTAACDENIVLLVHGDTVLRKDGDGAVVCRFANAH